MAQDPPKFGMNEPSEDWPDCRPQPVPGSQQPMPPPPMPPSPAMPAPPPMGYSHPELHSTWKHKRAGNLVKVLGITNLGYVVEKVMHPVSVVFKDCIIGVPHDDTFSCELGHFRDTFEPCLNPKSEHPDLPGIDEEAYFKVPTNRPIKLDELNQHNNWDDGDKLEVIDHRQTLDGEWVAVVWNNTKGIGGSLPGEWLKQVPYEDEVLANMFAADAGGIADPVTMIAKGWRKTGKKVEAKEVFKKTNVTIVPEMRAIQRFIAELETGYDIFEKDDE